jgi:hypothetical protein
VKSLPILAVVCLVAGIASPDGGNNGHGPKWMPGARSAFAIAGLILLATHAYRHNRQCKPNLPQERLNPNSSSASKD